MTSRTGTPWACAASTQASSSGLRTGGPKGPSATFTGMATEARLHLLDTAGPLDAGDVVPADAERRALAEHGGRDRVGEPRRARCAPSR